MDSLAPNIMANMAERSYRDYLQHVIRKLDRKTLVMATGEEIEQQVAHGWWPDQNESEVWHALGSTADTLLLNLQLYNFQRAPWSCGRVFRFVSPDTSYEDPFAASQFLTISYMIATSAHESRNFRKHLGLRKGLFG
ncbi:hypothetical protein CKO28_01500 [Rhodovibrio sodomensis]|uniref:Uncharacterized protein n=1 Tax=Rhodovibrio sodomensis TaxID=1088 RepID=A0ABS1D8M5_9PROT|nr:hypothetical protein [Rhodovibrio sodomensis]MBK1666720.1 hypothetical protein [Rhodovibrio sodomensis]